MKKRKYTTVYRALTRRLVIPVMTLWLLSMGLLTWAVGKDFFHQLESGVREYLTYANDKYEQAEEYPSKIMLQSLGSPYLFLSPDPLLPIVLPQHPSSWDTDDWYYEKWELFYGFQAAAAYYDAQGEEIISSGDYIYFTYTDRQYPYETGFGYIDLGELEGGSDIIADRYVSTDPLGSFFPFWMEMLYMTGYFEGNRFYPSTISLSDDDRVVYSNGRYPETVSIRVTDISGYNYEPGPAFTFQGQRYENAKDLLENIRCQSTFGLTGSVIYWRYANAKDGSAALAIYCNPLEYAALRLIPAYLGSLLLVSICLWWCLRSIHWNLTEPLAVINRSFEQNRVELSSYAASPWLDLQLLRNYCNDAQKTRHQAQNEVQQLQTALNYAQSAEENRRKMISAIAHELKTPLAVIHGYAEGLQSGIAEEKKEKYLSVILEESEQMDAMVLEMLELSRLEAGKVRLNLDQVSLPELARGIFEKLQPMAEEKELQVLFPLWENITVAADEARIGQVITNFATNALKYTLPGGRIHVRIYRSKGFACFAVENECQPLSQETLDQVWDSFFRADAARSGGGTGLGLAIAKNVVELHRGSCQVKNTDMGVEFTFRIPLS